MEVSLLPNCFFFLSLFLFSLSYFPGLVPLPIFLFPIFFLFPLFLYLFIPVQLFLSCLSLSVSTPAPLFTISSFSLFQHFFPCIFNPCSTFSLSLFSLFPLFSCFSFRILSVLVILVPCLKWWGWLKCRIYPTVLSNWINTDASLAKINSRSNGVMTTVPIMFYQRRIYVAVQRNIEEIQKLAKENMLLRKKVNQRKSELCTYLKISIFSFNGWARPLLRHSHR